MRIPAGENLGNATVQPMRGQNAIAPSSPTAASFGGGVAQAIDAAGQQVQQADQAAARRDQIEQERQRQIREAADKSKALTQMQKAQDDLEAKHADLIEGVRTGVVPKDKAKEEWGILSRDAMTPALEGTPTQHREVVQRDLERATARFDRQVGKAVTLRDQADIRGSINTILESTQRQYLTDPKGAEGRLTATLDSLGPYSGLDPAQLQETQQKWMEGTRYNRASVLVTEARRNNADLAKVEKLLSTDEFAALDPQRRAALNSQIETHRAQNDMRAEAAARRAQAAQEHRLRVAEAEVSAARMLYDEGKMLNESASAALLKATEGTPFAKLVPGMMREARGQTAFGMQPIQAQAEGLAQMRAELTKNGTDPDTEKRFSRLESIHKAKVAAFKDNPLKALVDYGLTDQIPPIDASSIAGVVASLEQRMGVVALAEAQTPKGSAPVSLFQPQEAAQVADALAVLPVGDQAKALQQLTSAMGSKRASAFAKQVAPKDKAMSLAMQVDDPGTGELILRGARALREKTVKENNDVSSSPRALITKEIGEAFPSSTMREDMIEAATLASYGQISMGNRSTPKKALDAIGLNVVEFNDVQVPLPKGMDEGDLKASLKGSLPQVQAQASEGKIYVDGVPVAADVFAKQLPSAKLMYWARGSYVVKTGSGVATDANRKPIIIKVQ